MPEKKKTAAAAPAVEAPAAEAKESKTRKSAKAPARRGRPPLAPELYVEFSGKQYNVTDIIDRAKAFPDSTPMSSSISSADKKGVISHFVQLTTKNNDINIRRNHRRTYRCPCP